MKKWRLSPIASLLLIGASQIAAAGTATVYYYKPYKSWSTVYIHHNAGETWTTVPGTLMDGSSCANWAAKTIDFGSAGSFQAVFNNGAGAWDTLNNQSGSNYVIGEGVHQVKGGKLIANAGNPCDSKPTTVYYRSGWAPAYLHYAPVGGSWTTAPGVAMEAACTGWQKKTLASGVTEGLTAAFNNGSGSWDNNRGRNYALGVGDVKVENGVAGAGNPCPVDPINQPPTVPGPLTAGTIGSTSISLSWGASTDDVAVAGYQIARDDGTLFDSKTTTFTDTNLTADTAYTYKVRAYDAAKLSSAYGAELALKTKPLTQNTATVYYYTATRKWSMVNIHYAVGGAWTATPGKPMNEGDAACANWTKKTVDLGSATGLTAAFNNGAGAWDNNGGKNYALGSGVSTVKDGVVAANAQAPCVVDTTPPSKPTGVAASANGTSITLTWNASTDPESAIKNYTITRTNGSATATFTTTATNYIDSTVAADTEYVYTVAATNAVDLTSAPSTGAAVKSGKIDTTPPTRTGTPIASVKNTTVTLTWAASTDPESAIARYIITRTGGAGSVTFTSPTTSYTDSSGAASTNYTYAIVAENAVGLKSVEPSTVSATTGKVVEPETAVFTWDNATVYFLMNDRFLNADTSNDRSYCRESNADCQSFGNDLTQMPSAFHGGDLKGITQKIKANYFKDLGVNAIWITAPYEQIHGFVYGNDRKHYGYHGYYTLDWTAIDKNMGTKADLQELVDAAHAQGVRVVMDIVLNHTGYENIKDMNEYGYGALKAGWEKTAYKSSDSLNWDNDIGAFIDYTSGNWGSTFWTSSWLRMNNVAGYDKCEGTDGLKGCVGFLPDVKTEVASAVGLPSILNVKWTREGRLAAEQAKLDAWFGKTGKTRTPANYLVKWLSDYVREFGIDGFRVDTAKHVDMHVWQDLKNEAKTARAEWLAANADKAAALKGDTAFWMTGEVWGHGVTRSSFFDNGFDSIINFNFQGAAGNVSGLHNTYSELAAVNADNSTPYNMLSYISSHDKGLFDRGNLQTGLTSLLLAPGGVQLFYGDESGRPLMSNWAGDHAWRGDMNWNSTNQSLLSHAQKLGKFRNAHPAVGAGSHTKLADAPYTFARVKNSDKVVIAIGASGTAQIAVGTTFADGTALRDAYTGLRTTVSGGKASVTVGSAGVVLLEAAAVNVDDVLPPTVPTALTKGDVTATKATLSWTASSDNVAVDQYEIYRGAELAGTSATTSFTDGDLTPATRYSYSVLAKDAAGNASDKSAALAITTDIQRVDVTAPSVPLNPVATASNTTVTLSWTASTDDTEVAGYTIVRTGGTSGSKTLTSTTNSLTDSGLQEETSYSYTIKAYDAVPNVSAQSAAASVKTGKAATVGGSFYKTNPSDQVGKFKSVTIDGIGTEWTADLIIAQGVANDDPRTFRGSHEGPVYDLYALYGAWDDSNLYLAWQFTNVTDVVDPAQNYPISDNGKPYQGDIPQSIAFDIDPSKGTDGALAGKKVGVWDMRYTFGNKNVDRIAMFSSKAGVGTPALFKLNADGVFDYATANVLGFKLNGIEFKYGDGFLSSTMHGINKAGWSGYTPADLEDSTQYIDFLKTAHDKKQNTFYEIKIPLTALGLTRAQLESQGIGVQLISTFGQSGIGSLPHDPAVLDNATAAYSADESTSKEKEDYDVLSVPFARIGKK